MSNGTGINGPETPGAVPANWIPIDPTQCAFTPRKLRVICVGAGFAGLTLAYKTKFEKDFKDYVDFAIYDKNDGVGGCWRENRYPGLRNDCPAHVYIFPFEPYPEWTQFYVTGEEILQYIEHTADKYGLDECAQFDSKVLESIWDPDSGKWKVKIDQQGKIIEDECDIFISGSGFLSKWSLPKIDGIETFKGKLMHSAKWDRSYDYAGKGIAVIGNGSSGIQLVASLYETAASVVNYIRNPTWISINFSGQFTPQGSNYDYSEEQKKEWAESPEKFWEYRKQLEASLNYVYSGMLKGSPSNKMFHDLCTGLMSARLGGDQELIEKFIPKTTIGCRRLTPGDGYLEALRADNVRADFNPIKRITEKGIETEAGEEEFDLIVCATGYEVNFIPSWKMVGKDGEELNTTWSKRDPEAYFSTCVANMPNFFMIHGPNCPIGHGSLTRAIGWLGDYILQWTEKIAKENVKSVTVKPAVVSDFNIYIQEQLQRTVWSDDCTGWYKQRPNHTSRVIAMYAGSVLHFKACLERIRGEDFDVEYRSRNRFAYLGNGELAREKVEGADLAFYMDDEK